MPLRARLFIALVLTAVCAACALQHGHFLLPDSILFWLCFPAVASLIRGTVIYPEYGSGADALLAEADRRMCRGKWPRRKDFPVQAYPDASGQAATPVAS